MSVNIDSYDPKYINIDDLPLAGPDDYTNSQKRRAAFEAEARLEADVNNGEVIPDEFKTHIHTAAVLQYSTHRLVGTAEEPSDVTLGDVDDDGDSIKNYADQFIEAYERLVDSIDDGGGVDTQGKDETLYFGSTGSGDSIAANTRDSDIQYEYPFEEDRRFPDDL